MEVSQDRSTAEDRPGSQGYNRVLRLFEPPHLQQILKIKEESILEINRNWRFRTKKAQYQMWFVAKAGGCFEPAASLRERIDRILIENKIH